MAVTTLEKGYYSLLNLKIPNSTGKSVGYKHYEKWDSWVQTHAMAKKIRRCDKTRTGYWPENRYTGGLKHLRSSAYRQSTDTRFSYLEVQSNTKVGSSRRQNDYGRYEQW